MRYLWRYLGAFALIVAICTIAMEDQTFNEHLLEYSEDGLEPGAVSSHSHQPFEHLSSLQLWQYASHFRP